MKPVTGLILLLASLLASTVPSQAQTPSDTFIPPSPIIGSWSFQTDEYREGTCKMSGKMSIRKTSEANAFTCSFVSIEKCDGSDRWVVEQTCEVSKHDKELTISSQIVNFLEAREFTGSYAADHFVLNIASKHLMTGSLVSAVRAPVEFRRDKENLS